MKVKLLKKVRKQYSIVYYPIRKVYEVKHPHYWARIYPLVTTQKTLESAMTVLKSILHRIYGQHTRKHKQSKINYKVWYNKTGD